MELLHIDEYAFQYEDSTDNSLWLGLRTGIPAKNLRTSNMSGLRESEGILIRQGQYAAPWRIEKFIVLENKIAALGPWIPHTRLWELPQQSEKLPAQTPKPNLSSLGPILSAVEVISQKNFTLKGFAPMAFRTFPKGGLLVCPLSLAEQMRQANSEDRRVAFWQNPAVNEEDNWLFFLGLLTWRLVTGLDPFKNTEKELRRERIRRGIFPHIMACRPGINPKLAWLIDSSLCCGVSHSPEKPVQQAQPHNSTKPKLQDWFRSISLLEEEASISSEIYARKAAENAAQSENLTRLARRSEKLFQFQLWLRQWRWRLLFIVLITAISSSLITPYLKKIIQGPVTIGLSPIELAQRFYHPMDEMDVETMQDCLDGKAALNDLRMVELLYVTNKVRQGMEGVSSLLNIQDWIARGRPPLPEGTRLWGITNLEIRLMYSRDKNARIEALYDFWFATEGKEWSAHPVPQMRRDVLHIALGRRAWEITSIERSTDYLSSDE